MPGPSTSHADAIILVLVVTGAVGLFIAYNWLAPLVGLPVIR
jgi:hypothetical protein